MVEWYTVCIGTTAQWMRAVKYQQVCYGMRVPLVGDLVCCKRSLTTLTVNSANPLARRLCGNISMITFPSIREFCKECVAELVAIIKR